MINLQTMFNFFTMTSEEMENHLNNHAQWWAYDHTVWRAWWGLHNEMLLQEYEAYVAYLTENERPYLGYW